MWRWRLQLCFYHFCFAFLLFWGWVHWDSFPANLQAKTAVATSCSVLKSLLDIGVIGVHCGPLGSVLVSPDTNENLTIVFLSLYSCSAWPTIGSGFREPISWHLQIAPIRLIDSEALASVQKLDLKAVVKHFLGPISVFQPFEISTGKS